MSKVYDVYQKYSDIEAYRINNPMKPAVFLQRVDALSNIAAIVYVAKEAGVHQLLLSAKFICQSNEMKQLEDQSK